MRLACPSRAILEYAAIDSDAYALEALVADAAFRGLASEEELRLQIEQHPNRAGIRRLRGVLDIEGGPQRTRSKGERWFLRLMREHGIEGFEANQRIHGKEVDFLWRELSFCVELDGWNAHKSRIAFERDRAKWALLQASGTDVMPISPRAAQQNEAETIDRLRRTLERKRALTKRVEG